MEWLLMVGIGCMVVIVLSLVPWFVFQSRSRDRIEVSQRVDSIRSDLQTQFDALRTELQNNLGAIRQELNQNVQGVQTVLSNTGHTLQNIGSQLGILGKTAEQILNIGKDISSLQDLLRPPKMRGELGEQLLENILAQCLPSGCYCFQYQFRDGTRVDALIRLEKGTIPIDAKFPLDSFSRLFTAETDEEANRASRDIERQIKLHIDSVARYIRPNEGTFDFALMYIPAENIYYEIAVKAGGTSELMTYALDRRVFPVSPNTFYAYLQAIAMGLRGLQIEQKAREIYAHVRSLEQQIQNFQEKFDLVGRHIRNALERYQDSSRLLTEAQVKLSALTQQEEVTPVLEPPLEDKSLVTLPPGDADNHT